MAEVVRFPSTFWTTLIQRPARARAEVFTRYRIPVFNFLRNRGLSEHDAEDVAQEVFLRVCREDFLKKLDRNRGKFRSLLLAVTRHVMLNDRASRHRKRASSIEQAELQIPEKVEPDRTFDDLWIKNLTQLALQRLQEECGGGGPRYYDCLVMSKMQDLSYAEIAGKLGVEVNDVTNWVHQGKERFKRYLRDAVQAYSSTEEEYQGELALLGRLLK